MNYFDVFELKQSINQLTKENKKLKEENQELKNRLQIINKQQESVLQRNDLLQLIVSSAVSLTSAAGVGLLLLNSDYQELNFIVQGNIKSDLKDKLLNSDLLFEAFNKMEKVCIKEEIKEWQMIDPNLFSLSILPIKFVDNTYAVLIASSYQENLMISDYKVLSILAEQINYLINSLSGVDKENNGVYLKTITSLTNAIDAKDVYTAGHSQRVSKLAVNIAQDLKLAKYEIQQVEYGAILHDIGKIGVPENILNKQGPLNDIEYRTIKKHPTIGVDILKAIDFLDEVFNVINYHHERVDGKGYPHGLIGTDIPIEARIVCIADAWDAMTSTRSYRRPLSLTRAFNELRENAGTQFDGQIIQKLEENKFRALVG